MFYLDLLRCLHEHRVRYLLVGGLAMNLHGVPRMTMDVDIVLALDDANLDAFFACARQLGLKPQAPVPLEALKDAGQPITLEAAAAKYFASEAVGRVADRAVQIHGGAGYIADYGIERLYRDVRLFRIYEGTSQIQQLVIARETIKNGG